VLLCVKRRAQRNHIGLAIRAFLRLELHMIATGISWYSAKLAIVRFGDSGLPRCTSVLSFSNCVTPVHKEPITTLPSRESPMRPEQSERHCNKNFVLLVGCYIPFE
jgi:hypothetical protein